MDNINVIGFVFTLTMALLVLAIARRFAVLPIIMTACYITLGQVIVFMSLNFSMFKIIIFFGIARIIFRKEVFSIRLHTIDKILITYVIVSATAYILLRNGSGEAIVTQLNFISTSLFSYFIFRALIRNFDDIRAILIMLALVMVPMAGAMIIENTTGWNLFSIFGGVPEFSAVRDGRLRCQGAFAHPILAGSFGATSLPLMVALWFWGEGKKWIPALGALSATVITITSASSGPVSTYVIVLIGMAMWHLRDHMRAVRWCMLLSLISLHLVMKSPVWALIGKLSEILGGTGWHRVMLIDAAISHFDEWWLLGTDHTRHWMPTGVTWSEEHTDITNHFIGVGIHGGFLPLILFVAMIVFCFRSIGIKVKEINPNEFPIQFTLWCLGVVLVGHLSAFTSVRYFDQIIVFWYLLLSMITTISLIPTQTLLASAADASPDQHWSNAHWLKS